MNINSSNNNVAFGRFNVAIGNDKNELKTYKLVSKILKQECPELTHKRISTKKTPGFMKTIKAWMLEFKGKDTEQELKAANALDKAGFSVTTVEPSPKERAEDVVKFLKERAAKKAEEAAAAKEPKAPAGAKIITPDELFKMFTQIPGHPNDGAVVVPPSINHAEAAKNPFAIKSENPFKIIW